MTTQAEIMEKIRKIQRLADNSAALPGERQAALNKIKHLNDVLAGMRGHKQQQQQQSTKQQSSVSYYFNWVYTKEKVNMQVVDGKIRLDFSDNKCTVKQFEFITIICRFYPKINKPERINVTYESACDFLAIWAPRYQRRWTENAAPRYQSTRSQQSSSSFEEAFNDIFNKHTNGRTGRYGSPFRGFGGFGGYGADWTIDDDDD